MLRLVASVFNQIYSHFVNVLLIYITIQVFIFFICDFIILFYLAERAYNNHTFNFFFFMHISFLKIVQMVFFNINLFVFIGCLWLRKVYSFYNYFLSRRTSFDNRLLLILIIDNIRLHLFINIINFRLNFSFVFFKSIDKKWIWIFSLTTI